MNQCYTDEEQWKLVDAVSLSLSYLSCFNYVTSRYHMIMLLEIPLFTRLAVQLDRMHSVIGCHKIATTSVF
jgi:hypothetical protein